MTAPPAANYRLNNMWHCFWAIDLLVIVFYLKSIAEFVKQGFQFYK